MAGSGNPRPDRVERRISRRRKAIEGGANDAVDAPPASLNGWPPADEEVLAEFVREVAACAQRPLPLWPPATFSEVFDAFADYYREEPGSYSQAIDAVVARCEKQSMIVTAPEVRFVGTGIKIQGYNFGSDAEPAMLAALWRVQLFDLCDEAEWMREDTNATLLATWCRASGETVDGAREDFIARTTHLTIDGEATSD